MVSKTFVIIKPDAISRGLIGRIISRFEDKQLKIIAIEMKQQDYTWCQLHYQHILGPVYVDLEEFMLSGPLIGIVLQGPNVVDTVRNMVGETDSLYVVPGTIRGDFGTYPMRYNIVHVSDSYEAVRREIHLFFSESQGEAILSK